LQEIRAGLAGTACRVQILARVIMKSHSEHNHNKEHPENLKDEDFITDATLYFGIGFEEMHHIKIKQSVS